ncbi:MAG: hypothetical protein Q7O12_01410 [Deltaproteobacteria bacterium]|nr:hypothetical protein [Deltaproteobacteria bacterium]
MRRLLLLLTILALVAAPEAFGAQDIRINPVPPGVKPQWTRVPGAPQVSWAPNLPTDVFRYGGKYYFFWANYFYQGAAPEGPWKSVKKVPEVFYQVDPAYFKTVKPAGETPAAPAGSTPTPKAKTIDIPPTAPPAQAPPELAPQTPSAPAGGTAKPPKVM